MQLLTRLKSLFYRLSPQETHALEVIKQAIDEQTSKQIKKQLKRKEITLKIKTLHVANQTFSYPHINYQTELNEQIYDYIQQESFQAYKKVAYKEIPQLLAEHIHGYEHIKQAITLQLATPNRLHILLLGDPGTGKTDLLHAADELSDISSMGLGSGTSGVGLSVTYHKGEQQDGLLVRAHNGVCLIDELNLLQKNDRAALYNAMEKGFITYDKAGKHTKIPANVKILATANPKNDSFEEQTIQAVKKQLPFEQALLSRFHLVYVLFKPGTKEFEQITKKILSQDQTTPTNKNATYLQAYLTHVRRQEVAISTDMQEEITRIATQLKEDENKYLFEITPRTIKGLMMLAQASARLELRGQVNRTDIKRATKVLTNSLTI